MPTLEFKGKQYIYSHHLSVPFHELLIDSKRSLPASGKKPNLDDNLIIHGDNLHALKALMPQYAGKIQCIYIDPPYNTGNEGWCYNDNVNSPLMKDWLSKNANPVDKEDMQRHDKWLCMMYPRLKLLHELLADDGVIFISIDDNEVHNLRGVMDEIWGEDNFITQAIWRKRGDPPANKILANITEYLLIYGNEKILNLRKRAAGTGNFSNPDNDQRGEWRHEKLSISNKGGRETASMIYPIVNPADGKEHYPPDNSRWAVSKKKAEQYLKEGRIVFGKTRPVRKKFKSELRTGITWPNLWMKDSHSNCFPMNKNGNAEIVTIFESEAFETPKPTGLIDRVLRIATQADSIILDSFAGSGTTAHAVLDLNKEDGGNRKFIMVEMEDYANDITAERVRRVIKGVPKAKDDDLKNGLGGSFTFCELGNEISIEKIITGESLPDYGALAKYVFYTATGKSLDIKIKEKPDFFVGETELYQVYLIYKPDISFLRGNDSALNDIKLKAISTRKSKKEKLVFATAKYRGQKELSEQHITFCQLPYAIHKVVGA